MNIRKLNEELEKLLERDFFDKLLYSKKDMETDIRNFLKNNVNEIGCCDYELGIDQNDYQLILTCQPYEDTFKVVLINADVVVLTLFSTLENVSVYAVYHLVVNVHYNNIMQLEAFSLKNHYHYCLLLKNRSQKDVLLFQI